MNAFEQCLTVEARSWDVLEPYLKSRSFDGRFVRTAKGPLALELQKSVGDVLANSSREHVTGIEVKAEERYTGNLFIERWSNRKRFTAGWLETLKTDLLWFHFLDRDVVYEVAFCKLREWLYWHELRGYPIANRYEQAKQGKYDQLNDTWGFIVPVRDVNSAGLVRNIFKPEQEMLQAKLFS